MTGDEFGTRAKIQYNEVELQTNKDRKVHYAIG